jgi:hypothetical protein
MSLLIAARTVQDPLVAEFAFNFNDTMVPVAGGVAVDFGESNTSATTVMVIPLPPGSTVTGGSIDTAEGWTGTLAVDVGYASDTTKYGSALAAGGLGSVPIVPDGSLNETGENIQIVFTAAASTVGKATVRVQYSVAGRACEVQIA